MSVDLDTRPLLRQHLKDQERKTASLLLDLSDQAKDSVRTVEKLTEEICKLAQLRREISVSVS